jgi:hypothetical protein
MSKRRAVIVAVTVEGITQADAARRFEVSESYVSRLVARYRTEGDAAFEPRSRRPHTSPTAIDAGVVELIVNLRSSSPLTVSMPVPTRSDGTSNATTASRCRSRRSGVVSWPPGW